MTRKTVVLIGLGAGVLAAAALIALQAVSAAGVAAEGARAKRPIRAPP